MIFPTFGFALFFLCVFVGFWYVFRRHRDRRLFLTAASYLFYAMWDWRFCFLLLASTSVNYGFGLLLGSNKDYRWRKLFMILSACLNLLILGFFKYYNFFAEELNALFSLSRHGGEGFLFPVLSVIMPVGISFYTFKAMSYVFDVYLCKIPPCRSFLDLALYISFFPQVASGPIVHAVDFLPQIEGVCASGLEPGSKPIEFSRSSALLVSGLLKKLVCANFLSTLFVDPVLADPASFSAIENFLAAIGYSVVIYTDFSGYSDLAIAVALLLGFHTPANFNRPYISFSVTDFWRRWHISFSSWLRNYLYFSFGGSRFGLVRTLFALFFTMTLAGLWHGAALTFLVWGMMQGLALVLERITNSGNTKSTVLWKSSLQITATFLFTTVGWMVFRASSFQAVYTWALSLTNFSVPITLISPLVLCLIAVGLLMHAIPTWVRQRSMDIWIAIPLPLKGILLGLFMVLLSSLSMSAVAPFIYFQF